MRKLIVLLVVLVLLFAAADVFARRAAEERVADRLQKTFDLPSKPDVSLRGTPFLLELLRGDISTIVMTGDRVRSEDVTLDDVEVEMHDVRFSLSDVVDGSGRVTAEGGEGSASITEASLGRALAAAGAPFTLSLAEGGAEAKTDAGSARGDVSLADGALTISAQGLPGVVLDLPSLGGRVTYEDLSIGSGSASLTFSVDKLRLSS